MPPPTLNDLPPPPGKSGWPWTEESPRLPDAMADGAPWPRISVVTPSYNQAAFLEETIRSVLLQGYPNLEYIVIDGASADGSKAIIERYAPWLSYWVSEPDRGQSHAINKGFVRSTGAIMAWLNSDDTYEPGALKAVAGKFSSEVRPDVVYGNANIVDEKSRVIREIRSVPFNRMAFYYGTINLHQASIFWTRDLFRKSGKIEEELRFAMDTNLWHRFAALGAEFEFARKTLSNFRWHEESKSASRDPGFNAESAASLLKHAGIRYWSRPYTFWNGVYFFRKLFWLIMQGDLDYVIRGAKRRVRRWVLGQKSAEEQNCI